MSCRKSHELFTPADEKWVNGNNEATDAPLCKLGKGGVNFTFRACAQGDAAKSLTAHR
jgi:hypothetical protein